MAKTKEVGTKWTHLTDYAYLYSEWTLNAESGRKCEVGVGVKIGGKPRGGRHKFSEHILVETYGIGAIHVRVLEGETPCLIRLDQGDAGAIPLPKIDF